MENAKLAELIVESQKNTLLERVNEIFISGNFHHGPEQKMDEEKGETFLDYWTPYEAAIYTCLREVSARNNEMVKGKNPDLDVINHNHREHRFFETLFWETLSKRLRKNSLGIRNGGIIVEIPDDESESAKILKGAINLLAASIFGSQEPKKRERIVDGPSLEDLGIYFIRKQEPDIPVSFEVDTDESRGNVIIIKELKATAGDDSTWEFRGALVNRGIWHKLVEGVYSLRTKTGWMEVGEELVQ